MKKTPTTLPFTWKRFRGEAHSEILEALPAILENLLSDPLRAGAEQVKRNLYRAVYRFGNLGGSEGAIYLKKYFFERASDRVKYCIFPTRARVEWKAAQRLQDLGIPTFQPLAFGELRRLRIPSDAFLITREIHKGRPLDLFLQDLDPTKREELLQKTAAILAQMHRHSIHHRDIHQSNLLARDEEGLEVFVIDLHTVRLGGELTRKERMANLSQLLHSLKKDLSEEEKIRFLGFYQNSMENSLERAEELWSKIQKNIGAIERRRARSRDKRCVVRSSQFDVQKNLFHALYRRRNSDRETIEKAIRSHRNTLEENSSPRDAVLKNEGRSRVTRVYAEGLQGQGQFLCVKELGPGGLGSAIEETLQGSRGLKAWKAAHALTRRSIPCPQTYALREERFLGIPIRSFLVMEYLEKSMDLYRFCETSYRTLERKSKLQILRLLARLTAAMHREGIFHRDFQLRNIVVKRQDSDWTLFLIDLESVSLRTRLTPQRRLRNLMQMNDTPRGVSRSDRLRFVHAYERFFGAALSKEELKTVIGLTTARQERAARIEAAAAAGV